MHDLHKVFQLVCEKVLGLQFVGEGKEAPTSFPIQASFQSNGVARRNAVTNFTQIRDTCVFYASTDPFRYWEGEIDLPDGTKRAVKIPTGLIDELEACGWAVRRDDYRKKEARENKEAGATGYSIYKTILDLGL